MDREITYMLAHTLFITMVLFRIAIITFFAIFIWEVISKWSEKSVKAQCVISLIICLIEVVRLIVELCLNQDCSNTIIMLVAMIGNVAESYLIIAIKEKTAN